jgi:hypothetical protein
MIMKRALLIPLFSLALGGCSVISSSGPAASQSSSPYSVMESRPPDARNEDVPKLTSKEVWVPGYYQPVAGTWVWHQGQVMAEKDGYRLLPAAYREENGKVYFTPPRWRRADLSPGVANR